MNYKQLTKEKKAQIDILLDQVEMNSYNAIIYNRNQLEYIQGEVRKLEKEFNNIKMNDLVSDLSSFVSTNDVITKPIAMPNTIHNKILFSILLPHFFFYIIS